MTARRRAQNRVFFISCRSRFNITLFIELNGPPGMDLNLAQKRQVTINDFEQLKVIGRGGFSKVVLARKIDTGRLYAIKILKKDQLVNENKIKPIISERTVLS